MSEPLRSSEHEPGGAADQRLGSGASWLTVAVTGALVVAVVVGLALVLRPDGTDQSGRETDRAAASKWGDPQPAPQPAGTGNGEDTILCTWFGPVGEDDPTYCDRVVSDTVRRTRLTARQRADAEARADAVEAAIDRHGDRCAPMTGECAAEQARRRLFPPPSADQVIVEVRRALEDAGFAGAIVRSAGSVDPAPRNTIVYGIPIGDACLVGYLHGSGSGGKDPQPLGALPGGQCLA
ncbi:hypothetical protein [Micromonospora sp. DT47]|uniref:hypothetical protein n=1 Tax=Micromonospora sp. DT47 TaxID=3393431 RepID=UPI003CECEB37